MDRWNALENVVADQLQAIFPQTRLTRGSGRLGDADVRSGPFLVECKYRTTKHRCVFLCKQWQKICQEALQLQRFPLLVMENSNGDRTAVLEAELYKELCDPQISLTQMAPVPSHTQLTIQHSLWEEATALMGPALVFPMNNTPLVFIDFDALVEKLQDNKKKILQISA